MGRFFGSSNRNKSNGLLTSVDSLAESRVSQQESDSLNPARSPTGWGLSSHHEGHQMRTRPGATSGDEERRSSILSTTPSCNIGTSGDQISSAAPPPGSLVIPLAGEDAPVFRFDAFMNKGI